MNINRCMKCHGEGMKVLPITLGVHLKEEYWKLIDDGFYFCPSPECDVVYFNNSTAVYFRMGDVKTRVGIKEKEEPKPLCYCNRVTEKDLVDAMERYNSVDEVVEVTKVGQGKWCVVTNPSGRCCEWYLKNYLEGYSRRKRKGSGEVIRLELSGLTCAGCISSVKAALESAGAEIKKITLNEAEIIGEDAQKYVEVIKEMGYDVKLKN